ncbi:hypothetical protein AA904_15910 [Geobacillus stearothermophilus]|nr:hypothetical protein AA904_15910 [Geobacillus stearothermophilus]KMY57128.1 hypothetical protein AA906_14500 [Geobacillus stearothermophilus]KMY59476.1 hypothetical protein AA905_11715 [Geobacillus stearothermophilus]
MLSFEHKKAIFRSFKQLQEKPISNNRVNYVYPESLQRGKILARELSPSGNGYVNGKYIDSEIIKKKGYNVDRRGWINIADFSEEQLREVIEIAMMSMSGKRAEMIQTGENLNHDSNEIRQETSTSFERLVRSCLYNWLGYGNVNAPVWFIGVEEGGAEIWRHRTKTLEQSLEIRSKFHLQMDFRHVWEDLYNISLSSWTGPNVWRYIAAFILEIEGRDATVENINDYIFYTKQLGRESSNHFLGEMMPLPKPSKKSIKPYESIWNSVNDYYDEVANNRLSLIRKTIIENQNVKLLVSYDRTLTEMMLNYFSSTIEMVSTWNFQHEQYTLYKITFSNERSILMLSTPFFGNGRISYNGIRNAARRIINEGWVVL